MIVADFRFSTLGGGGGSRTEVAFGGRAHRWRAVVAEGGAGKHAEITKTTAPEANRTLLIVLFRWRWRESNPRPNKEPEGFLHV